MKKLIFFTISILIMSCSKDQNLEVNNFNLDVSVDFSILNSNGEDLLNPKTLGYFPFAGMQLYYEIDGIRIAVQDFDPQAGGNNGIMLINETVPYRLRCFPYSHGDEGLVKDENGIKTGISIAYLKLNGEVTDTIKTEWESKEDKYFINTKVWYNDVLQESAHKVFSVVK